MFFNLFNKLTGNKTLKFQARAEGLTEGRTEIVKNLLRNTDFTLSKIASLAGVKPTFVSKIKKGLQ